ncbi:MAG: hypothetical protein ACXACO_08110 [Promethearchaeota archaeon]
MNDLKKWNLAYKMKNTLDHGSLLKRLTNLKIPKQIKLVTKSIPIPITQQAAILDFEGNPVFLIGFLFYDTLFSYYIEDYNDRNELYQLLFEILKVGGEYTFFAFSSHEETEIQKISRFLELQEINLSRYGHIEQIPIVNLQLGKFESLAEALFSIFPTMKITGDILFRDNKLVDQLFYAQKFSEIVAHNHNCLKNEAFIFSKRWIKLYTI